MMDEDGTLGLMVAVVAGVRDAVSGRVVSEAVRSVRRIVGTPGRVVPVVMGPRERPSRRFPST